DGRQEDQVEPGMEQEEGGEVRLVGVEEAADLEGEGAERDQEDGDEHIGQGRQEISRELAQIDRPQCIDGLFHAAFSGRVRAWKASSSFPEGARFARSEGVASARISPRSISTAREHMASTSSSWWVEIRIALSAAMREMRARIACFWLGSRPSVGSSR